MKKAVPIDRPPKTMSATAVEELFTNMINRPKMLRIHLRTHKQNVN